MSPKDNKDNQDNQDVFDSLLDTYTMDDTMERKIHAFSQNKQRSRRIQRARDESAKFQETYSRRDKIPQDEIVLGPVDLHAEDRADLHEKTGVEAGSEAQKVQTASSELSSSPAAGTDISATQPFIPGRTGSSPQGPDQTMTFTAVAPGSSKAAAHPSSAVSSENLDATRVHQPASQVSLDDYWKQHNQASVSHEAGNSVSGRTMVFKSPVTDENNNTVIMDEKQLQKLSEESGPSLRREYVAPAYTPPAPSRGFNWKIPVTVLLLVVLGIAGVGGWQMVNGWMDQPTAKTEENSSYYDQLLEWARKYASLDDDEKKDITSLERLYNRLSDSQKSEIDKVLTSITGKSFDELLAAASSGEKEDSNNNNTEIAEKKAQLRDQIAQLQAELASKQQNSSASQSEIDSAFTDLTEKNSALEQAKQAYNTALVKVSEINNSMADYNNQLAGLQSDLSTAQSELDQLLAEQDPEATEENPSILNARNKVTSIQDSINTIKMQKEPLDSQLSSATQAVTDAQNAMNAAQQAADAAQNNYDSLKNGYNYQPEIDSLQNQIAQLQGQLDAL